MDFQQLHWMLFDGSPLLLIPRASMNEWLGMMSPYDENINRNVNPIDIEEIDDKEYYINDKMDFDNPETHYDNICNILHQPKRTHFVFKLANADCMIFDSWGDGFAWWEEEKILFNGEHNVDIAGIQWVDAVEYQIGDGELVFMNSAIYGADPSLWENEAWFQVIRLAKGSYKIEKSSGEFDMIFKFTQIKIY